MRIPSGLACFARAVGGGLLLLLTASMGFPPAAHAATGGAASDSLSIEQCVALARMRAPSLVASEWDRTAAVLDSVALSKNLRPEWSANAGGTIAPRGFYDPAITNLGDYEAKLAMAWTAADGGRRTRARERGSVEASAARWRSRLAARDAGLEAAELAIRLLRLQRADSTRRAALEWLDRLAGMVRSGVVSGVRGPSDSIRVTLERDAAVAALESDRLEARITALELLNRFGREQDTMLVIREPHDLGPGAVTDADSVQMLRGLDQRPEVQLARAAEAQGRLDLLDAKRRNAPTVEVALDAGFAGSDLTRVVPADLRAADPAANLGDRLRRDMGASAAIRFHLPLRDAAARPMTEARLAALSAARVRGAAEVMAQRRLTVGLIERWRTAARQLDASQVTGLRAERNLLKLKSLYSGGAASLLDLLDAWHTFQEARDRVEDSREQSRVAYFQLEDRR